MSQQRDRRSYNVKVNAKEKHTEHMNRNWDRDHKSIFDALQQSGDFENFHLALKCLANEDYNQMKKHISMMVNESIAILIEKSDIEEVAKIDEDETLNAKNEILSVDKQTKEGSVQVSDQLCALPSSILSEDVASKKLRSVERKYVEKDHFFRALDTESDVTPSVSARPRIFHENFCLRKITIELSKYDVDEHLGIEHCDPADCTSCVALPYPLAPQIGRDSLLIYAGPGSGKTEWIKSLRLRRYFGRIFDTDHMSPGFKVPPKSLVFTNRPDVLEQYDGTKIAFLPFRRHWLRLCSTKCPNVHDSWYDDAIRRIHGCILIRRNAYIGDCIRIKVM